jgi:hypothetical protein
MIQSRTSFTKCLAHLGGVLIIFLVFFFKASRERIKDDLGIVANIPWSDRKFSAEDHNWPIRVGLIGDSITNGIICSNTGYGNILKNFVGETSYTFEKFCVEGTFMTRVHPKTREPFPAPSQNVSVSAHPPARRALYSMWALPHWKRAVEADADVYLILLGTCDALSDWFDESSYRRSYLEMIQTLRNLPRKPVVFVVTSPPLVLIQETKDSGTSFILPALQAAIANESSAPLINAFAALGGFTTPNNEDLLCDRLHPSFRGAWLIATAAFWALKAKLVEDLGFPSFALDSPPVLL